MSESNVISIATEPVTAVCDFLAGDSTIIRNVFDEENILDEGYRRDFDIVAGRRLVLKRKIIDRLAHDV